MTRIRLATVFGDQGIAIHEQELLEFQEMVIPEKLFVLVSTPTFSSTFAEAAAQFRRALEKKLTP